MFNNDLTIEENKEYWFKVMPLAWNIREYDGEGYALLDSQFVIDGNIIFDEDVSWYPESSIREWLNNDFLKKAFHGYESELVLCNYNITSVDGDETNMSDYVFLHSSSDEEYLMSLDPILTSEYTRCKGVSMDFSLGSSFWLSTQAENGQVYYYHSNHLYQGSVNILRHGGIKPQIKVNLNYYKD